MQTTRLSLAAIMVAACATFAQAQEPQPGQTVNAVDGNGYHVSGILMEYDAHHRNGINPGFASVRLQRYNHTLRRTERIDAWYPTGGYVVGETTVNGVPLIAQPQQPTYIGHLHLSNSITNSGNSWNRNNVIGATASSTANPSVVNNNQDDNRNYNTVVNPAATGYARYGYLYYNGVRYPIRRYYYSNGVRCGYYDPYYGSIVRW